MTAAGGAGKSRPPSLLTSPSLPPLFPVPAGRTAAAARAGFAAIGRGGGKSGLQGSTVAANGRRGRPQGKCHREQTARAGQPAKARVKRCGKSAPRVRQRRRHGKPHREQDRIGAARVLGRKLGSPARSSPPPGLVARGTERSAPQRNGRRGGAFPPNRTRLTGRLATDVRPRLNGALFHVKHQRGG